MQIFPPLHRIQWLFHSSDICILTLTVYRFHSHVEHLVRGRMHIFDTWDTFSNKTSGPTHFLSLFISWSIENLSWHRDQIMGILKWVLTIVLLNSSKKLQFHKHKAGLNLGSFSWLSPPEKYLHTIKAFFGTNKC